MAKKISSKQRLAVLEMLAINRLKNEAVILSDVGTNIKRVAKELGIKPKLLAETLVPLYKRAQKEALSYEVLKKASRHHHGH